LLSLFIHFNIDLILKHKGNLSKLSNYNQPNKIEQGYLNDIIHQRNGSHSQAAHYENILRYDQSNQAKAQGLRLENHAGMMLAPNQLPHIDGLSRNLS